MSVRVSKQLLGSTCLALGLWAVAHAQVAPEARKAEEARQKQQETAPPRRTRVISSEVASQLAAMTPKYTPPAPKPAPKTEQEMIDLRDIDKPRNDIIRLPEVYVREARTPVLNERAVHTEEGLREIAFRRYISEFDRAMNRFHLPILSGYSLLGGNPTERRAMTMYEEDERLRHMAELDDAARMVKTSDAAAGEYVRREAQKTYLRSSEFGWNGGSRKQ